MGIVAIASPTVWTSQNDVAQTPGQGKTLLELQMQRLMSAIKTDSYILAGSSFAASSTDLNLSIAAGSAYINGFYVTWPSATVVACAASNINYVYAQLTRDGGGLVTGLQFNTNITGTAPDAYSLLVAVPTAGGSTLTSVADARLLTHGRKLARQTAYTGAGPYTFVVPGGVSEIKVRIWGAGGGGGGGGYHDIATGDAGHIGGRGGYSEGIFSVTPGVAYTVTIGTGGAGGSGGNVATLAGAVGGTGTTTSFGALCTATSGTGGSGGAGSNGGAWIGALGNMQEGVGTGGTILVTGGGNGAGYGGQGGNFGDGAAGGTGISGKVVVDY